MNDGAADDLRIEVLARILSDRERGSVEPLRHYLALFPAAEEIVACEYFGWRDGSDGEPTAREAPADGRAPKQVGPFRLLREIGRGGQGIVHLAEDSRDGTLVALKLLDPSAPCAADAVARFAREAAVTARLDHPGICAVHDTGLAGGQPYIAMRHVPGATLAALLRDAARRGRALIDLAGGGPAEDLRRALALIEAVARALEAAHAAGVVHRDIKPGNIMVMPDGRPVLLDFGLARESGGEATTLTRPGEFLGTPPYLAPEQIAGTLPRPDAQTDVYALGVVLFEVLTLRRPFDAPTPELLRIRIETHDAPDPRRLNPAIPRPVAVIIGAALEKDRARRYRSAQDLADDLRRALDGEPISVRPPSAALRLRRWTARRPALAGLVAVLALLVPSLFALGGYLAFKWPDLRRIAAEDRRARAAVFLERGYFELEEGAPGRALRAFRDARAIDAASAESLAGLVLAHLRARDAAAAHAELDAAGAAPDDPVFLRVRADVLRLAGRPDEAARIEAGLGAPQSALELFVEGSREFARGDDGEPEGWARALGLFTRAVLESRSPQALYYFRRAAAASRCRDRAAASETADAILRLWPGAAISFFFAGYALVETEPARAVDLLREAVALDPGEARFHFNLGNALRALGDRDAAARSFERALALRADYAGPKVNLGNLLCDQGRLDEAEACLREGVVLAPRESVAWFDLGGCLQARGSLAEAEEAYERALSLRPGNVSALSNLATIQLQSGRPADAVANLRRAIQRSPADHDLKVNLGAALRATGELEAAAEVTRAALALKPDSQAAWCNLGIVLDEAGDDEGAIAAWRRVVAAEPERPEARLRLARALRRSGRFADALAVCRAAEEAAAAGSIPAAIQECREELEAIVALDARLAAGGVEALRELDPRAQRFAAELCAARRLWAAAAQHHLASRDAGGRTAWSPGEAALIAARAGLGAGADGAATTPEARAAFRALAREWLDADLAAMERLLAGGRLAPAQAQRRIDAWRRDEVLRPLREAPDPDVLPAAERAAWSALWQSANDLLAEHGDR